MKLCVIPARGGSKRIPRKNIKDFCGKPVIAYSIEAAKKTHLFEHIIVSTDDQEIAEVALQWGAEVPFIRPAELADDYAPTRPVVNHAINSVTSLYGKPDYVCCLYPAAPFVQAADLIKGFKRLIEEEAEFSFTVTHFPSAIQRALKMNVDGRLEMFNPELRFTRSQDLEEAYHDAGQFYWGKTDAFLKDIGCFTSVSVPIILPRYLVQDIDTPEDWRQAELMFLALNSESGK